jgi:hypothetical protein
MNRSRFEGPLEVMLAVAGRRFPALALLAAVAGLGVCQANSARHNPPPVAPHYSSRQLRTLIRNARTPEDHDRLALYFRTLEREFHHKQTQQQQALAGYLNGSVWFPSKYPTRGDSARSLASYYGMKARKAARPALEQERLAAELRAGK